MVITTEVAIVTDYSDATEHSVQEINLGACTLLVLTQIILHSREMNSAMLLDYHVHCDESPPEASSITCSDLYELFQHFDLAPPL